MRFLSRSLTGLFLVALTLGLLFAAGLVIVQARSGGPSGERVRIGEERVFAANVIPINPQTMAPILTAYGEIRSQRELQLRAAATGRVLELGAGFAEGAAVNQGDLLLRIDPASATAARDTAQAALAEAKADLALAERTIEIAADDLAAAERQSALRAQALERQSQIDTRGLGRAADTEAAQLAASTAEQSVLTKRTALSQAEAALDQARAALAGQEIALSEAERDLRDTRIIAPFDGRLADIAASEGGLVSANEQVARLIDPAKLEVAFRVSTAQFTRLIDPKGAPLAVPVEVALPTTDADAGELSASATLIRVGAAVEAGASGRQLFARIEAGGAGLRPGDFVTVRVREPELEAVALLPARAVSAQGTVLVLGDGDRLEEAAVSVLRRQGDTVLVRAPTLAGREVVAERSPLLGQGIKIRPTRPVSVNGVPGADTAQAESTVDSALGQDLVDLDPTRRAALIAFVEASHRMPAEAKARTLAQLREDRVPAAVIARLEARMGG